ncbi:MAG: hypothetical protein J0M24_12480 [Verrucomicrobia bacterium]|nr:hypothetical protein [Verrucomicrobiota bacterium]
MNSVRRFGTLRLLLPLWLGAVTVGAATPTDNPYLSLTNRNAFGIRPPAPPPAPEVVAPPPAAPPNVFLTGVSNSGGQKKAYFAINRPGGKTAEYETVFEGEELEDLKVLEIDAKNGSVRTLIGGREVTLNFKDNGLKSVAGTPVPGVPGRPGAVPTPVAPVPTQAPQFNSGGPVVIGRGGVNLSGGNQGYNPTPAPAATYSPGNVTESASAGNVGNIRQLPVRPGTDVNPIQNVPQPTDSSGRVPLPLPPPTRFNQ